MNIETLKQLNEDLQSEIFFHEEAPTSEKQVEHLENIESIVDNLYDEVFNS